MCLWSVLVLVKLHLKELFKVSHKYAGVSLHPICSLVFLVWICSRWRRFKTRDMNCILVYGRQVSDSFHSHNLNSFTSSNFLSWAYVSNRYTVFVATHSHVCDGSMPTSTNRGLHRSLTQQLEFWFTHFQASTKIYWYHIFVFSHRIKSCSIWFFTIC